MNVPRLVFLLLNIFVIGCLLGTQKIKASVTCSSVNEHQVVAKHCPENEFVVGAEKLSPTTIDCAQVVCE